MHREGATPAARRHRRRSRSLSLAWSVYATAANPAGAYFVTPTRIWELGAGAVLALWTASAPGSPVRAPPSEAGPWDRACAGAGWSRSWARRCLLTAASAVPGLPGAGAGARHGRRDRRGRHRRSGPAVGAHRAGRPCSSSATSPTRCTCGTGPSSSWRRSPSAIRCRPCRSRNCSAACITLAWLTKVWRRGADPALAAARPSGDHGGLHRRRHAGRVRRGVPAGPRGDAAGRCGARPAGRGAGRTPVSERRRGSPRRGGCDGRLPASPASLTPEDKPWFHRPGVHRSPLVPIRGIGPASSADERRRRHGRAGR